MKIEPNCTYSNKTFCGYKEAKIYTKCTRLYNRYINHGRLYSCNLNRLEGIQEGLKTFEGLSMKQIASALTDLHAIDWIKGCANHCLHCYANAQPFIKRFPFENFKQIMDDIAALKGRLGFSPVSHRANYYVDSYWDSDVIDMHLYDKEGKKHDAIEIAALIHESTDKTSVFDTNGWDRNDTERQQIAEDYVKQLLDDENSKHFYAINISLNPFNPTYVRALRNGYDPKTYSPLIPISDESETAKTPQEEKAENDYREYIANEVNTLFTFTPLLLKGKLNTIIRGLKKNITNMDGLYLEDYAITLSNILSNLYFRYLRDLDGERKVIKNGHMFNKAMKAYEKLFNKNSFWIFSSGRMEKLYRTRHNGSLEGIDAIDKMRKVSEDNFRKIVSQKNLSASNMVYLKIITPDGRVYFYDNYAMIPTDIKLNTGIEDINNPYSCNVKDFVLTTDMMDRI